jgi:hypothetical protein
LICIAKLPFKINIQVNTATNHICGFYVSMCIFYSDYSWWVIVNRKLATLHDLFFTLYDLKCSLNLSIYKIGVVSIKYLYLLARCQLQCQCKFLFNIHKYLMRGLSGVINSISKGVKEGRKLTSTNVLQF